MKLAQVPHHSVRLQRELPRRRNHEGPRACAHPPLSALRVLRASSQASPLRGLKRALTIISIAGMRNARVFPPPVLACGRRAAVRATKLVRKGGADLGHDVAACEQRGDRARLDLGHVREAARARSDAERASAAQAAGSAAAPYPSSAMPLRVCSHTSIVSNACGGEAPRGHRARDVGRRGRWRAVPCRT